MRLGMDYMSAKEQADVTLQIVQPEEVVVEQATAQVPTEADNDRALAELQAMMAGL